mmetsp:Transcript_12506/g.23934  ORF Transcript_12506/g.23934 Transcript_12506/m.23934 type:complete len:83 (-) Transcript_12506:261-509(-)
MLLGFAVSAVIVVGGVDTPSTSVGMQPNERRVDGCNFNAFRICICEMFRRDVRGEERLSLLSEDKGRIVNRQTDPVRRQRKD